MYLFTLVLYLTLQLTGSTKDQIEIGVKFNQCANFNLDFLEYSYLRPIARDNTTAMCHWAFSQGPCAEGDWFYIESDTILIPNKTRVGKCKARRCPGINESNWEFPTFPFLYNESCMTTDDINVGFCGSNLTKVYFGEGDFKPRCSEFRPTNIKGRGLFGIFGDAFNLLRRQDPVSVESKNRTNTHKKQINGWK